MIDTYALLIGIVFFGGYGAYKVYKALNEKTRISKSQNFNLSQEQKAQDSKIEENKPPKYYDRLLKKWDNDRLEEIKEER